MRLLLFAFCFILFSCNSSTTTHPVADTVYTGKEFEEMHNELARGWNTWNTRSVLSHVLLPDYIAINLKLRDHTSGEILEEALIGRRNEKGKTPVEKITPGDHSYDGSYTSLDIEWQGLKARIQSAVIDSDLVLLISPLQKNDKGSLLVEPSIIWNKKGEVAFLNDQAVVKTAEKDVSIYHTFSNKAQNINSSLSFPLADSIGISTGEPRSLQQIQAIVQTAQQKFIEQKKPYQKEADLYNAMQRVLAWDVIYEPDKKRVIAPVSRVWSAGMWKGWVLFDWDTYFSSMMLGMDNKPLAYANAIAITNEITKAGFVPNFAAGLSTSNDRSQPPVGSLAIKELYKKYKDKWLLHETFDKLLTWNRWWELHRQQEGYLCWGSDPYTPEPTEPEWLTQEVNKIQGAKWESGLDNSPMYDDIPFDTTKHQMLLADAGLMALYINDCDNLAEIALVLDKKDIAAELKNRGKKYAASLQTLWDPQTGFFLNKRTDSNSFSCRLSPTLFYPLLAGTATREQADRMITDHFYNEREFWGDYILPSIARNDPAYKDQEYWRGRVWAPMNFLVYLGLRKYPLDKARKDLVEKSKSLILKSWLQEGAVYENYNANTGQGDDVWSSDKFYHWGGLLAYISFIEQGYVSAPELPIQ